MMVNVLFFCDFDELKSIFDLLENQRRQLRAG